MLLNKKVGAVGALAFAVAILAFGIASQKALKQELPVVQDAKSKAELTAFLEAQLPGLEIEGIEKSPIDGFYQAFYNSEVIYVSQNGQYLFSGTMLELGQANPINHSQRAIAALDVKRAPKRAKMLSAVDETEMVVYKAEQEKYVINVFTDVDCGYCRKLHKTVPELNQRGVTVRYLAYPRAGIGSSAYQKLVSVWCADDKQAAMNDAKLKRQFGQKTCKNPVASQFKMTQPMGLSGTPAIITESGQVIGGYLSPEDLLSVLEQTTINQGAAAGGQSAGG